MEIILNNLDNFNFERKEKKTPSDLESKDTATIFKIRII